MSTSKSYTGDGSTYIFQSGGVPNSSHYIGVFLNGSGTPVNLDDYTVINNAIVFDTAPANGVSVIVVTHTEDEGVITSPTDAGIVADNIQDINRIEDSIDNVDTVADDLNLGSASDISTVGNDLRMPISIGQPSHIETVSTNMDKVVTVSDNIADVQTVAADLTEQVSEIETVADDLNEKVNGIADSEIEIVAGSIDHVDRVGDAIQNHHMNLIGDDLAKASDGDPNTESFVSNAKIYAQSANTAAESAEASMEIVRDREDLMSPHYDAIDALGDATTSAALDRLNTGATASNIDRLKQSADNLDRVHTSIDELDRVHTSIGNVDTVGDDLERGIDAALTAVSEEMSAIIVETAPVDQVLYDLITSTVDGYQRGDIDNDGDINISDSIDVLRFIVGLEDSTWIRSNILAPMLNDMSTYGSYFDSFITTVATDIDNVNIVGQNIDSVNTVSADIAKVIKVADDLNETISEVETVANDLNETISEIDTVANDLNETTSEIEVVAGSIDNVNTVGTDIANVNKVGTDIASVNTVADSIDNEHMNLISQDLAKAYDGDPNTKSSVINSHSWSEAAHVSALGTEVLNQAIGVNHVDITNKHVDVTAKHSDVVTKHADVVVKHGEVGGWRDETEQFRNEAAAIAGVDMQTTPTGNPSVIPVTGPDGKLDVEWMNLDVEFVNMATGIITNSTVAMQALFDALDNATSITGNASDIAANTQAIADANAALSATVASLTDVINTTIAPITDDLDGQHNAGQAYNFALHNQQESGQLVQASQFEYQAEIMRNLGGSGVTNSRQYTYGGPNSYDQPHDVGYSAINAHNHNNYKSMVGQAETSCILNGYYLRTRHNDYSLKRSANTSFLATEYVPLPSVPPSVTNAGDVNAQTAEMREYFKAYAAKDTSIRDYRPYFQWTLSYIEVWLEQFDDDLTDPFHSFRHSIDANSMRQLLEKSLYIQYGGHKNRFENIPFFGQCIRIIDDEGVPHIGTLKYRMVTQDVGDVGEFAPWNMIEQRTDFATYRRYGYSSWADMRKGRGARFAVPNGKNTSGVLDTMMGRVPGLDGQGATDIEQYTQYGFTDTLTEYGSNTTNLNAAYYNRHYSHIDDASSRTNAKRGFNDPMMFTATTQHSKVMDLTEGTDVKRFSYAMPFELILRTPLENWNPHNLEEYAQNRNTFGAAHAGTQADPYPGYNTSHYYAFTPDSFFDGATVDGDPADTDGDAIWVQSEMGTGAAVPVRNSGIHIHLPPIAGVTFGTDDVHGYNSGTSGVIRTRYPIYSTYWEGNATHAEMKAHIEDQAETTAENLNTLANTSAENLNTLANTSAESAAANATLLIQHVLQPQVDAAVA